MLLLLLLPPNRVAYVCQKLIKNSLRIHTQQVASALAAGSQAARQNGEMATEFGVHERKRQNKKECEMNGRLGFKCLPKLCVRDNSSSRVGMSRGSSGERATNKSDGNSLKHC